MCVWEEEVDGWAKRPRPPSPFFLCPLDLQIKANMRLKILALIGNMRPSEILVLFEKTVFFFQQHTSNVITLIIISGNFPNKFEMFTKIFTRIKHQFFKLKTRLVEKVSVIPPI